MILNSSEMCKSDFKFRNKCKEIEKNWNSFFVKKKIYDKNFELCVGELNCITFTINKIRKIK